jgi:hypothetical protein
MEMGESVPDFERASVFYEHLLHEQLEKVLFMCIRYGFNHPLQVGQDLVQGIGPDLREVQAIATLLKGNASFLELVELGRESLDPFVAGGRFHGLLLHGFNVVFHAAGQVYVTRIVAVWVE